MSAWGGRPVTWLARPQEGWGAHLPWHQVGPVAGGDPRGGGRGPGRGQDAVLELTREPMQPSARSFLGSGPEPGKHRCLLDAPEPRDRAPAETALRGPDHGAWRGG